MSKRRGYFQIADIRGVLVPLSSAQEANNVADAMSAEARAAGHPLVCRYAAD